MSEAVKYADPRVAELRRRVEGRKCLPMLDEDGAPGALSPRERGVNDALQSVLGYIDEVFAANPAAQGALEWRDILPVGHSVTFDGGFVSCSCGAKASDPVGMMHNPAAQGEIERLRTENERTLSAAIDHFSRCTDPEKCVDDRGEPTLWLGCAGHIRAAVADYSPNKEAPHA